MAKGGVLFKGGVLLGFAAGLAIARRARRRPYSFQNRSVVITGGSRGLGLALAREFAGHGARIAILARKEEELQRAKTDLEERGAVVLALVCDVRKQEQVNDAMARVMAAFGRIDVLVNNAGVMEVGPFEHMTLQDFEEAMAVHCFGPLFTTLAAVPHMRALGEGRIVNIASIGGKIAVPHLLPYCASKFALVGLSDGFRAELRRDDILVTTVCPGLMRTGSPPNAIFKGKHRFEYAWFSVSGAMPLLSLNAQRAARTIVSACRRGASRVVLGAPAKTAVLLNELFPGAAARFLATANSLLPNPRRIKNKRGYMGRESTTAVSESFLTDLNKEAAIRYNE